MYSPLIQEDFTEPLLYFQLCARRIHYANTTHYSPPDLPVRHLPQDGKEGGGAVGQGGGRSEVHGVKVIRRTG